MTIKKKIAAIAAAAMMAMSMTAISASAEICSSRSDPDVPKTLNGNYVEGVVSAGSNYSYLGFPLETYSGLTFYAAPGRAVVTLDIDNYRTGALVAPQLKTESVSDEEAVMAVVGSSEDYGISLSLFCANEVYAEGQGWGAYTQVINVR